MLERRHRDLIKLMVEPLHLALTKCTVAERLRLVLIKLMDTPHLLELIGRMGILRRIVSNHHHNSNNSIIKIHHLRGRH